MMLTSLFSTREQVLGQALYDAVPMMEFDLKGIIVSANTDFLNMLGHPLNALGGKPYTAICDPVMVSDGRAETIWRRVADGETLYETLKLQACDGSARWMQACLLPVRTSMGRIERTVLVGFDITATKQKEQAVRGLLESLSRTQAVAEFCPQSNLLYANATFLEAMGYSLNEIAGRPHRTLCEYDHGLSCEYSDFWDNLVIGKACHDTYVRYGKGARPVPLKASYNPVFDDSGTVTKVVLYATLMEDKQGPGLQKAA